MSELIRERHRRTEQVVAATLFEEDASEHDEMLVGDTVVVRKGTHYRIASGGDEWEDLEAQAERLAGRCDCGGPLSSSGSLSHCRSCGRDYRKI
ncbi:MAG: hypothetical protein O7F10_11270 [Deltaproteobacteria bacterium]|nr:hypothetical protein [Deltaproteobacteria bacterium]TDJ04127.1 MAG: hypothetical protein E2O71_14240 [Deltaproteobacteria bacterium]